MIITILTIQFLTFIFNFVLGIFVLYKNHNSRNNFYFWLFTLGVAGWNFSLFMTISGLGADTLLWGRIVFSVASLMPVGLYLFASSFPWRDKRLRLKEISMFALGGFFAIVSLTDLIIRSARVVDRTYITGELSPFYLVYLLYYFGFLILSFIRLTKKYKSSQGIDRTQLKYVNLGTMAFLVPLFITQLILPIVGIFRFNNLGPLFSVIMIASITYAITRHRFLDIRLIIQRSVFYLITITITSGIYLASILLIQSFIVKATNTQYFLSSILTSIIIIISFPAFKNFFHRKTDSFFYKNTYNYWETLRHLTAVLISTIRLDELLDGIGEAIRKTLKVGKCAFILTDVEGNFMESHNKSLEIKNDMTREVQEVIINFVKSHPEVTVCDELKMEIEELSEESERRDLIKKLLAITDKLGISVILPTIYQAQVNGIFLLGHKLSGDVFLEKDIQLFKMFSQYAAVALDNAKLYEITKDYGAHLEEKINERTAELQKLFEAQKRFLADISHELQTPLSIIKTNTELLRYSADPDKESSKTFRIIDKTIDQTSLLVRNLLTMARGEMGHLDIDKHPILLSELLGEVNEDFQVLAEDHGIKFEFVDKTDNVTILGDREKLRELLMNLISNALKFTSAGGIVKLTAEKKGDLVQVKLVDTGRGIDPENLPHIFERFYRSKNGGEFVKGTGLGLAISKQIVEMHQGTISVKSQLGVGTEVEVLLPLQSELETRD